MKASPLRNVDDHVARALSRLDVRLIFIELLLAQQMVGDGTNPPR